MSKLTIPNIKRKYTWGNALVNELFSLVNNEVENPVITGEERLRIMSSKQK